MGTLPVQSLPAALPRSTSHGPTRPAQGSCPSRRCGRAVSKGLGRIAVLLVVASCNFYRVGDDSPPPVGNPDAGSNGAPPVRHVVAEGGVVGIGTEGGAVGGPGGIGVGAGKNDGGRRDVGPSDVPVVSQDAPTSGLDTRGGACFPCTLGGQGCPSGQACYRSGGAACCATAGELPVSGPCAEDQMCAPGLVCVDSSCTPTCNTATPTCGLGSSCRALAPYPGTGYCAL
jgi:hypothetical protein